MIDKLNLASEPFRNRTLPWTVAVAVSCASVVALLFIISAGRQAQARADRVEVDVRELRAQEQQLRVQTQAVTQALTPEQRIVLDAAHQIMDRKEFAWSRLLADLEAVLPATVRVARISVRDTRQVAGQTRAELELTVVGRAPQDITNMIGQMDRGGTFAADLLTEQPRTARGEPGIEAALRVRYTPRVGGPIGPVTTAPAGPVAVAAPRPEVNTP